jgi:hypothetical protein
MTDVGSLAPDAPAIILLCSSVGAPSGSVRPFGPVEWTKLAETLRRHSFRGPRDLIGLQPDEIDRSIDVGAAESARIAGLLGRSGQLAFELDRLQSRGVWVVTIADDGYPTRLRERLGSAAPPVLFGSGPPALLTAGGVAIVGSREVDASAVAFTERLATAVVAGGSAVVSGGARGIDVTSMRTALDVGGSVIGVLPEGVERRLREATTRTAIADGQAVLVSPYHPSAGFSVGAAMGRNKLIYAISDVAVVVSSADRAIISASDSIAAAINLSGVTSEPKSWTWKPAPSSIRLTRFLIEISLPVPRLISGFFTSFICFSHCAKYAWPCSFISAPRFLAFSAADSRSARLLENCS